MAKRRGDDRGQFGGQAEPAFQSVEDVFRRNFRKGLEHGAMFAVYYKGQKVVDLWGGFQDKAHTRPWQQDTISMVMSVTKGMCATCLALLADRGHLDYDELVATYWPEFAQKGKHGIQVKTLISHQAGLPVVKGGPKIDLAFSQNHEAIGQLLAQQKPRWEPGSAFGYHSISMGWYMDQLIRRVDPEHRSAGQFFQEEIAKPFDIDFYLGVPADQEHRVARIEPSIKSGVTRIIAKKFAWKLVPHAINPRSNFRRSMKGMDFLSDGDAPNTVVYHQAELPMNNGIGSARGIAKLYSILAGGGRDLTSDRRLLSESMCARLSTPLCQGRDKVYRLHSGFGYGMMVIQNGEHTIYGHPGVGGIAAFADPQKNLSWCYVPNKLVIYGSHEDDPRYTALKDAMYDCVAKMERSDT